MAAPKGNKNAKGNKGGGRKPLYKVEYAEQCFKYSLLSATDEQMCDLLGVGVTTFNQWKKDHVEFFEALKAGKFKADAEIANSLYHRAKGFKTTETDIRVVDGVITKTEITKEYPPDTAAAIIWLKNRQRDKFRDKQPDDDAAPVIVAVNVTDKEAASIAKAIKESV